MEGIFCFPFQKTTLKVVGTQGVWLGYCSCSIDNYIRYICIRWTDWEEKHNCWVKFLWVSISHSCFTIKTKRKFHYLNTKPKSWQYRPCTEKERLLQCYGCLSDLGLSVGGLYLTVVVLPHVAERIADGWATMLNLGYGTRIPGYICGRGGGVWRHRPTAKSWAHGWPAIRIQTWGPSIMVNNIICSLS